MCAMKTNVQVTCVGQKDRNYDRRLSKKVSIAFM